MQALTKRRSAVHSSLAIGLLLCVVMSISPARSIAEPPATNPANAATTTANGVFPAVVFDLRLFSPKSGLAVTQVGIFRTEGSLDHWKGVAAWDKEYPWIHCVGGSEKTLYLRTVEYKQVIVKEGWDRTPEMQHDVTLNNTQKKGKQFVARDEATYTLWRWTADSGLTKIRTLPASTDDPRDPTPCAFSSDLCGVFADGAKLVATVNGGKTWADTPIPTPKGLTRCWIHTIRALSDREFIVVVNDSQVARMKVDDHARLTEPPLRDMVFQRVSYIGVDPSESTVWLHVDSKGGMPDMMLPLELDKAPPRHPFTPFEMAKGESFTNASIAKGRLFTLGNTDAGAVIRVWNTTPNEPTLLNEISIYKNRSNLSEALGVPGSDDVWLLINDQQLIKWTGQKVLTGAAETWPGPTIDGRALQDAQDHWPPGENPSRLEAAALEQAQKGMTPAQLGQWIRDFQTMLGQFDNYREQVLWMTQHALDVKAGKAANP